MAEVHCGFCRVSLLLEDDSGFVRSTCGHVSCLECASRLQQLRLRRTACPICSQSDFFHRAATAAPQLPAPAIRASVSSGDVAGRTRHVASGASIAESGNAGVCDPRASPNLAGSQLSSTKSTEQFDDASTPACSLGLEYAPSMVTGAPSGHGFGSSHLDVVDSGGTGSSHTGRSMTSNRRSYSRLARAGASSVGQDLAAASHMAAIPAAGAANHTAMLFRPPSSHDLTPASLSISSTVVTGASAPVLSRAVSADNALELLHRAAHSAVEGVSLPSLPVTSTPGRAPDDTASRHGSSAAYAADPSNSGSLGDSRRLAREQAWVQRVPSKVHNRPSSRDHLHGRLRAGLVADDDATGSMGGGGGGGRSSVASDGRSIGAGLHMAPPGSFIQEHSPDMLGGRGGRDMGSISHDADRFGSGYDRVNDPRFTAPASGSHRPMMVPPPLQLSAGRSHVASPAASLELHGRRGSAGGLAGGSMRYGGRGGHASTGDLVRSGATDGKNLGTIDERPAVAGLPPSAHGMIPLHARHGPGSEVGVDSITSSTRVPANDTQCSSQTTSPEMDQSGSRPSEADCRAHGHDYGMLDDTTDFASPTPADAATAGSSERSRQLPEMPHLNLHPVMREREEHSRQRAGIFSVLASSGLQYEANGDSLVFTGDCGSGDGTSGYGRLASPRHNSGRRPHQRHTTSTMATAGSVPAALHMAAPRRGLHKSSSLAVPSRSAAISGSSGWGVGPSAASIASAVGLSSMRGESTAMSFGQDAMAAGVGLQGLL